MHGSAVSGNDPPAVTEIPASCASAAGKICSAGSDPGHAEKPDEYSITVLLCPALSNPDSASHKSLNMYVLIIPTVHELSYDGYTPCILLQDFMFILPVKHKYPILYIPCNFPVSCFLFIF